MNENDTNETNISVETLPLLEGMKILLTKRPVYIR